MIGPGEFPVLLIGAVAGQVAYAGTRAIGRRLIPRARARQPGVRLEQGEWLSVSLMLRLPRAAVPEDVSEWLCLMVGGFGTMSADNPLYDYEPEAARVDWAPLSAGGDP